MDTRKGGRSGKVMKGHKYNKNSNLLHSLTSQYSIVAFICVLMFPYLTNPFLLITSFPYIWSSFCNPKCLFVVVNVIVIFLVGESRRGGSTNVSEVSEIYEEYVKRSRRMRRVASLQEIKQAPHAEKVGERQVVEVKELESGGDEAEAWETNKVVDGNKEEKQKEEKEEVVDENEAEVEKGIEEKQEEEEKVVDENEEEVEKGIEEKQEEEEKVVDENEEEKKGSEEKQEDEEKEDQGGLMPTEELNKRVEAFIARVNKQRLIESRLIVCCKA